MYSHLNLSWKVFHALNYNLESLSIYVLNMENYPTSVLEYGTFFFQFQLECGKSVHLWITSCTLLSQKRWLRTRRWVAYSKLVSSQVKKNL